MGRKRKYNKNNKCNDCDRNLIRGKNCSPSTIEHSNYLCRRCWNLRLKKIYHKDLKTSRQKAKLQQQKFKKNHPEAYLNNALSKYRITSNDYQNTLKYQKNKCGICDCRVEDTSSYPYHKRLSVDHDHTTGQIRGLLCNNCNRGLGLLGDSLKRIERAVKYLKRASEITLFLRKIKKITKENK